MQSIDTTLPGGAINHTLSGLKNPMTRRVIGMRVHGSIFENASTPLFSERDQYYFGGELRNRIRIILKARGCSVPTCTMCPLPNNTFPTLLKEGDLLEQVKSTLEPWRGDSIIALYNNGNFFSSKELLENERKKIYQYLSQYSFDYLMVESLPQFINQAVIDEFHAHFKNTKLIVGIGLQSENDIVREVGINTRVTKDNFLKVTKLLRLNGHHTKAYVMFKPPFLSESESFFDSLNTVQWLHENQIDDIAITPLRIAENTVVHDLYKKGLYLPPHIATIVRLVIKLQELGIPVHISTINLKSGDFDSLSATSCSTCKEKTIEGFNRYNMDPNFDLSKLICADCDTKSRQIENSKFLGLPIPERISEYMNIN